LLTRLLGDDEKAEPIATASAGLWPSWLTSTLGKMKIALPDGSFAFLQTIVQDRHYRRGYRDWPADAEEEILRLARLRLSSDWRVAPIILLSPGKSILDEMMRTKKLPGVLSVGAFSCVRGPKEEVAYRYVAWLEEEISLQMSPENEARFRALDWTSPKKEAPNQSSQPTSLTRRG
jgi:hypothetical protein